MAVTSLDLEATVTRARKALSPICDLRPELYRAAEPIIAQ